MASRTLARAVRLEHRDCRVVHQDDHGGGAAGSRQLLDHFGHVAQSEPAAADIGSAHQAEQAGLAQGADVLSWERAVAVDARGGRANNIGDDTGERSRNGGVWVVVVDTGKTSSRSDAAN